MRSGEEILAGGSVEQALEKYRDALSRFRALSDADPKNIQFHSDVAAVLARMGAAHLVQAKAAEALAELKRSLAEIGNFSRAQALDIDALEVQAQDQFRMGKAYALMKQWPQAEAWFERSIPTLKQASERGSLRGESASMLKEAPTEMAAASREVSRR